MATESRIENPVVAPPSAADNLPARLLDRPFEFGLYQALRILHRAAGAREPIGSFTPPGKEAVRLGSHVSLGFPPTEIHSLEFPAASPPLMRIACFGLLGASGVLPTIYTELAVERMLARDRTLRDFLDLFQHRLASFLYRAWEKYHFPVAYERGARDSVTPHVLDLIGMGTAGLAGRQPIPDQALVYYAGLLGPATRPACALKQLLADYFAIEVDVQPFAGAWRPLDPSFRTILNESRSPSERLGIGTVLGDEVWDQESVVRIRLGPLTLAQYEQFLPGGPAHEPLRAWVKFYCGEDLDVEVQLVLRRDHAPRAALDVEGQPAPRLGWVSWMFTQPLGRDPDETILRFWERSAKPTARAA
ncbi:MAG: type VI secretion system baseplate subunit TssG [Acidobacteria bacterium]|nr:type VI secretion system baseplate subunit TssG [Acidobacteriota bacterium]